MPTLSRALEAMHADVARRWTLTALADIAGMSRSSFAAHFESVTRETPIAYLTRWRMVLAADRMANSGMTITDVASMVGMNRTARSAQRSSASWDIRLDSIANAPRLHRRK